MILLIKMLTILLAISLVEQDLSTSGAKARKLSLLAISLCILLANRSAILLAMSLVILSTKMLAISLVIVLAKMLTSDIVH